MMISIGGGDAVTREGLEIPTHDYIENTYDASNNLLTAIYKRGGASGRTVATLTLTYDVNNNLSLIHI